MMRFEEQLKKAAQSVRMGAGEKEALKKKLLQFIEAGESVRVSAIERQKSMQRSRFVVASSIINRIKTMPIYAVILLVALLGGGGVSAAAQGSLPGDALYRVKEFNQSARAALTFEAKARAGYEVKLAESKLREAAVLAAKGELKTEVRERIEVNFEEHANRVAKRIEKFEAEGRPQAADDVAAKFETSLRVHGKILERLAERAEASAEVKTGIEEIAVKVSRTAAKNEAFREGVEGKLFLGVQGGAGESGPGVSGVPTETEVKAETDAASYAELRRTEALNAIRRASEYVEANSARLSADVIDKARSQLRLAKNTVEEGSARLQARDYRVAVYHFRVAFQIAEEVMIYLKTQLAIESQTDVKIEFPPLIPVPPFIPVKDASKESIEPHGDVFLDTKSGSSQGIEVKPLPVVVPKVEVQ